MTNASKVWEGLIRPRDVSLALAILESFAEKPPEVLVGSKRGERVFERVDPEDRGASTSSMCFSARIVTFAFEMPIASSACVIVVR